MYPSAKRWLFGISIAFVVVAIAGLSFYKIAIANAYRTFPELPPLHETWLGDAALQKPVDAKHAERGRWLMSVIGCRDCHGAELTGAVLADDLHWRVSAPALVGASAEATQFTSERWRQALRLGIDGERRGLWGMPRRALLGLRDEDAGALIAAVKSAPLPSKVPEALPHSRLYPRGYIAVATRVLWPLDRDDVMSLADGACDKPTPGEDDQELGAYMASLAHCASCHQTSGEPRYSSVWDSRQGPPMNVVVGDEQEKGDARQTRWQHHACATRSQADVLGPASIHRASLFTRRQQDALFLVLRQQLESAAPL